MKTAAVYLRVSTNDQAEHSPDSQLREIKNYAARHKIIIDPKHIYTDTGISGRNAKKRPAFQRMIAAAKSKPSPFDTVLIWKYSRFARNQEESILYKSLLRKECGVEVVSITEETGDNMFGPLIERIIEWMDEFYSIRLSEEVRTKMTFVAEKGKVQTTPPFGYTKKPGQPMEIVPDEAEWVRYIFAEFVKGKSLLGIAKDLNVHGVRTHRGNQFENRTIEYILHNPMYIGYVRWTPTGKTLSKRIYDSEDTLTIKGDFPAIISEDLFSEAAALLQQRKKSRKKYAKPADVKKHWLSGLVHCGNCGGTLTYSPKNDGFQCYKYAKGVCKVSHFINARKLEEAVLSALEQVVVTEQFIKDNTVVPVTESTIDYAKQIAKLEAMMERAKAAYVAGIDTIEEYGANKERIAREITSLLELQKEEENKVEYPAKKEVEKRLDGVIALLRSDSDIKTKNLAISSIVKNVEFSRVSDTLKVYFYL